ncbi:MAG: hypothetical protein FWG91_11570 [Lachnospiraceae bacterium]|nr:hypothetical protein [Lachnospiraceae bacterium]
MKFKKKNGRTGTVEAYAASTGTTSTVLCSCSCTCHQEIPEFNPAYGVTMSQNSTVRSKNNSI